MCMRTTPAPDSPSTSVMPGVAAAVTSLTISAPASRAARATSGFDVSIDTTAPPDDESLHNRDHPPQLLDGRHGLGAGPGRFAADVDQVRPQLDHLLSGAGCRSCVEMQATIREGIRGDVYHPHDQPPGDIEGSRPKFPGTHT